MVSALLCGVGFLATALLPSQKELADAAAAEKKSGSLYDAVGAEGEGEGEDGEVSTHAAVPVERRVVVERRMSLAGDELIPMDVPDCETALVLSDLVTDGRRRRRIEQEGKT